ncbi:hypothetical protein K435DRAFT_843656 [Dendrothele bispora CBS 962.96]|uniref:Uncharacterized protein n=1 Tax=Dendrothele bispora (strain CBS 962.96) TaxID=1314807 RepID=A0A4S8L6Y7_DENBC|nr:hypothetical protein K435DRAFT_843656 [Dendrothele bispora CBS 962.96]
MQRGHQIYYLKDGWGPTRSPALRHHLSLLGITLLSSLPPQTRNWRGDIWTCSTSTCHCAAMMSSIVPSMANQTEPSRPYHIVTGYHNGSLSLSDALKINLLTDRTTLTQPYSMSWIQKPMDHLDGLIQQVVDGLEAHKAITPDVWNMINLLVPVLKAKEQVIWTKRDSHNIPTKFAVVELREICVELHQIPVLQLIITHLQTPRDTAVEAYTTRVTEKTANPNAFEDCPDATSVDFGLNKLAVFKLFGPIKRVVETARTERELRMPFDGLLAGMYYDRLHTVKLFVYICLFLAGGKWEPTSVRQNRLWAPHPHPQGSGVRAPACTIQRQKFFILVIYASSRTICVSSASRMHKGHGIPPRSPDTFRLTTNRSKSECYQPFRPMTHGRMNMQQTLISCNRSCLFSSGFDGYGGGDDASAGGSSSDGGPNPKYRA